MEQDGCRTTTIEKQRMVSAVLRVEVAEGSLYEDETTKEKERGTVWKAEEKSF